MALDRDETLADLRDRFPRAGRLHWIGLRPEPRGPMQAAAEAVAVPGLGLLGDHRAARTGGNRQVTLIQHEHLAVVAALCGLPVVPAELLRRNLVVGGLNLLALIGLEFRVGQTVLLGSGPCHPCSRMEQALGAGGYNAVRGHGGITARVLAGGTLRVGDPVQVLR
jgi:MOSC domain-containing protein YiiM